MKDCQSLYGRRREKNWLGSLLASTDVGKRGLLIHGPAGIGKSTLLAWLRSECTNTGVLVSLVRTPPSGAVGSLFPLPQIIAALAGSTAPAAASTAWPCLTLADELQRAAKGDQRIVLLLDDIDSLPSTNLELFLDCLAIIDRDLILVATARSPGVEHFSNGVSSSGMIFDSFMLDGLDQDGVHDLIAQQLGAPPLPSLTRLIVGQTMGNPLYIKESVQSLSRVDGLRKTGGFWSARRTKNFVPQSLRELLLIKIAALSEDARELLVLLSILGREVTVEDLCEISSCSEQRVVKPLSELEAETLASIASESSNSFATSHPLVGASVLESLTRAEVGMMHGKILDHLKLARSRGSHVSSAEIAHHAVGSHRRGPDIDELLKEAATEAETLGNHRQAADWYSFIARHSPDSSSREAAAIREAIATCAFDPARSKEMFEAQLSRAISITSKGSLLKEKAQALRRLGLYEEALASLQQSLTWTVDEDRWDSEHGIAVITAILGNTTRSESDLLSLAKRAFNEEQRAKAIGHLGQIAFCGGDLVRGFELFQKSHSLAQEPAQRLHSAGNLGWALMLTGRWTSAATLFDEWIPHAMEAHDHWNLIGLLDSSAKLHAWIGEFPEAVDLASRSVAIARHVGNNASLLSSLQGLGIALLESDAIDYALEPLVEAQSLMTSSLEPCELSFTSSSVGEAYLLVGDSAKARECLELARANLNTAKVWIEAVDRLEAQIELAEGNPLVAVGIARPWIEAPGQVVFEHARMLEVAAQAYVAARDRVMAQSCAQDAHETYTKLGAAARADHLSNWMTQKLRGPGRPRMRLPGGLTEREHDVLRHVITGKTNKDIARALTLSVSTVNKHVEHIIFKAGVARRTELVSFAHAIDQPADSLSAARGR